VECEVWSVRCECEVWSVKWGVLRVKCEAQSLEVECGV